MKKIQMKAATMAARLCGIGLTILGLSACDNNKCMYGTIVGPYNQTLKVNGTVSSEDGNHVENATIEVKYPTGPNSSSLMKEGEIGNDGIYDIEIKETGMHEVLDRPLRVVCKPSKDSGLEADSTDVQLSTTEISTGNFESIATANFHLKKKKP